MEPVMAAAEVLEPSAEDYAAFEAAEVRRCFDMSVDEFIGRYLSNDLPDGTDESDPTVSRLVALLGIGQNGRSA